MLPKIHKKDNPGRPIVSSVGSLTEKISAWIDETLKPLARLVPSYTKDTTDFLNQIKNITLEDNSLMATIDVSALYTNIPHQEGLRAIRGWLLENNIPQDYTMLLTRLAEFVLTRNYFVFNGQVYLQVQGTAMGTRMAPNYSIIFMHVLETRMIDSYPLKPTIWRRFIDDIFMIWDHG